MTWRRNLGAVFGLVMACLLPGCEREPAGTAAPGASTNQVIAAAANDVKPLPIGAKVPPLTLRTSDGEPFYLSDALAKKPTVLVFYRGGWCMYCNMHFGRLKELERTVLDAGWQIIAVSPDRPEKLRETVQKHAPMYTLVSDSDMAAAKAFGIAFRLDEATLETYAEYGIDLEDASGRPHHLLPVPAVFLVNTAGVITFQYVNPDYKIRLDPAVLLAAITASSAGS
ncbi:MAG: peroxiredoxin-like family protein [Planctomycetota bacterium]